MKRRLFNLCAVASLLIGFAACSDNNTPPPPGGENTPEREEIIDEVFIDPSEFVTSDDAEAIVVNESDVVPIATINAKYAWTVEFSQNELSPAARAAISRAEAGDYKYYLSLNPDGSDRQEKLQGTADNSTYTIYLVTPPAPPAGQGNASATVEITFNIADNVSETFTLIKSYVGEVDVTFTLSAAKFDGEDFVYNSSSSDDMWDFEPVSDTLNLYFAMGAAFYQIPVKIQADFEFAIKSQPDWLTVNNENVSENGVYTAYYRAATTVIDNPEGEIVFVSTGADADLGIELTYPVAIPNYGQVFTLYPGTYKFDALGTPVTDATSTGAVSKTFTSADGAKAYIFTLNGDYYELATDSTWISLTITDITDEADQLLRDYQAVISVSENTGFSVRDGLVLIMPPYAFNQLGITEQDFAEGLPTTGLGEMDGYVFGLVSQFGKEILYITEEEAEDYAELGAYFMTSPADAWYKNNMSLGKADAFYDFIYTSEWNNTDPIFLTPDASLSDFTFSYYDGDGYPIEAYDDDDPQAPNWLEARYMAGSGIRLYMYPEYDTFSSPDYAHEGFVVISSNGTPMACVHCIFDEDYTPGDSGSDVPSQPADELVSFVSPDAVDGAELLELTTYNRTSVGVDEGEWNELQGQGTQAYILNYFVENPTDATLNVPANYIVTYMPYGEVSWLSSEVEDWGYSSSTMTVKMTAPGDGDATVGKINFQDKETYVTVATIYCRARFAD